MPYFVAGRLYGTYKTVIITLIELFFLNSYLNKSSENFADLYGTMLSSEGTYVIKFTGTTTDIKTGFGTKYWKEEYERYFDENIKWTMSTENQIKGLLKFNFF